MSGCAVADVETTGLFPAGHDRIVEIAVVHVSPVGEVERSWVTLVNPQRDLGPQHVYGISASDVLTAPTFAEVAGTLALVVFTGDMARPRDEWISRAAGAGLISHPSVTRKVALVIAADPDSLSGKARKAADYGIPIVTERAFSGMLEELVTACAGQ